MVIGVRLALAVPATSLGVLPPGRLTTGEDWRERVLVGWSGMRGAVSLAAALALPLNSSTPGRAFAGAT